MECSIIDAHYAVVGVDIDGSRGVLSWNNEELDAHRKAKEINEKGGDAIIFDMSMTVGEISDNLKKIINKLMFS